MPEHILQKDFTLLREEFAAFRAELRIEMITIKERLRRIHEQPVAAPSLACLPPSPAHREKQVDYSTTDITRLAVHWGISESSMALRIKRLRQNLPVWMEQEALPEDKNPPSRRMDLAEARMLGILPII